MINPRLFNKSPCFTKKGMKKIKCNLSGKSVYMMWLAGTFRCTGGCYEKCAQ